MMLIQFYRILLFAFKCFISILQLPTEMKYLSMHWICRILHRRPVGHNKYLNSFISPLVTHLSIRRGAKKRKKSLVNSRFTSSKPQHKGKILIRENLKRRKIPIAKTGIFYYFLIFCQISNDKIRRYFKTLKPKLKFNRHFFFL